MNLTATTKKAQFCRGCLQMTGRLVSTRDYVTLELAEGRRLHFCPRHGGLADEYAAVQRQADEEMQGYQLAVLNAINRATN